MSENHKTEPVIDPFSLVPSSKLPEIADKLLEAGMSRPGDIFLPEEFHKMLGLPVTNQGYKNMEGFKMSEEKLEKLEKLENNFLEAFRNFEEAKKELRLVTGWSFQMTQNILCREEDNSLRDDLIERMRTIANEFVTK